jgi:hypothetical protein
MPFASLLGYLVQNPMINGGAGVTKNYRKTAIDHFRLL